MDFPFVDFLDNGYGPNVIKFEWKNVILKTFVL